MAHISEFIKCPKCQKQFMKKSNPQKFGLEYFCHNCHEYFGVNELVNQWGYDAGDLFPTYPVTHADYKKWMKIDTVSKPVRAYSEWADGEPNWDTAQEREESYQGVTRMHMGISEYDDYADLLNTQQDALQIGVQ